MCAAVRVWYIMSPVGTRGLTWSLGCEDNINHASVGSQPSAAQRVRIRTGGVLGMGTPQAGLQRNSRCHGARAGWLISSRTGVLANAGVRRILRQPLLLYGASRRRLPIVSRERTTYWQMDCVSSWYPYRLLPGVRRDVLVGDEGLLAFTLVCWSLNSQMTVCSRLTSVQPDVCRERIWGRIIVDTGGTRGFLGVRHLEEIVLALSLQPLIDSWNQQGINLNNPADDRQTEATFGDCGRPPTADVLELYRHLDGFADGEYCRNHWSLWSLAKIRDENHFNPSDDVWFADYLIDSYYFSLHADTPQTSSVHVQSYDGSEMCAFKVADTLTDFLQKLFSDPASVHVFPMPDVTSPNATVLQRLYQWWKPHM